MSLLIGPNEWEFWITCCANFEFPKLYLKSLWCTWNLVWRNLSVWPIYLFFFQRDVRTLINKSPGIIPPKQKWKYTCMNPIAPSIRGLIKIHKTNSPIRPVVNWKNAPAYKIAKKFAQHISTYLPLPFTFNVKNSQHLITDLGEVQWNNDSNMVSFDITNMYTNIPTDMLPHIIQILCDHNNVTAQNCNEMLQMCRLITSQNYFTFLSSTYIQHNGLAMGSPTSSILSEMYLQYLEHTKLIDILIKHQISG
jgi:hypothetical protein